MVDAYEPQLCPHYRAGLKALMDLKLEMPPVPGESENIGVYLTRRAAWQKRKLGALKHHSLTELENYSGLKFSILTILCEGQIPKGEYSEVPLFALLRVLLHPCLQVRKGEQDASLAYAVPCSWD